jgi:hypothetical protein
MRSPRIAPGARWQPTGEAIDVEVPWIPLPDVSAELIERRAFTERTTDEHSRTPFALLQNQLFTSIHKNTFVEHLDRRLPEAFGQLFHTRSIVETKIV